MTDTPVERSSPEQGSDQAAAPTPKDETPAGERSPREDMRRTPGDGTLQDATPAGLSADELRRRAEEIDGSAQPGTG
ncbi:hypothetical protein [Azospirillum agricola]|uniref:hypothetical protein n=1 Tax=Azospirillum agricola TaxID=1720247 RepID=UPI000A0EED31|nr:hypothetical protein [Azospirillum agricola]MBP2229593.1 hypothetical protein [Azospirillum agricola]SMH36107.1 hypothetical protein SAMN02982994_0984 [Azospirillum lipoferum]